MALGKTFALSILLKAVDRTSGPLKKLDSRLARVNRSVGRIGSKMTKSLTLPLVGLGVASARAMSQFEQGMSNVSTLIDTSTENIDEMGKKLLRISRRVPVEIDDLAASLYDVRSAGIEANEQFVVLERSARLAKAGLGTTQQAVDLVTSSINGFSLEGEEANKVYDNIFKTVKNGKTTIDDLSQGFGAVAGTVAASGTKIDEYLASVSALTTTGLPAAQAHRQLRAVITSLTKDTKETRKVFQKLGAKDLKDLIAQSGGLVPALERITEELGGNEAQILKLVGRTEALNAIIGLTGGQAKAFNQTLHDMREGSNAVDEAFEKQNKTQAAQWQRTKNALTSVAIELGRVLMPVLEKLAGWLQKAAKWFSNLDDSTKEWVVRIGAAVAVAGPLMLFFSKLVGSVIGVTKALGKMVGVLKLAARAARGAMGALPGAGAAAGAGAGTGAGAAAGAAGAGAAGRHVAAGGGAVGVAGQMSRLLRVLPAAGMAFEVGKEGQQGFLRAAKEVDEGFDRKRPRFFGPDGIGRRAMSETFGPDVMSAPRERGVMDRLEEVLRQMGARGEGKSRLEIDIRGAPVGTRTRVESDGDDDIDLSLGFALEGA